MAKLELFARITADDGTVIEKRVEADEAIPNPSEVDLSSREGLLRPFNVFERVTLDTTKELHKELAEEYINSKKN